MDSQTSPRKIIALILGVLFLAGLLLWLWQYLHAGRIIITTNNQYNTITLTEINSDGSVGRQVAKARGELSASVGTGQYVASVTGNSVAATQIIKLTSHKTLRYTINPISATGVEPVVYDSARDIVASSNRLFYLDADANNLNEVSGQNNTAVIDPSRQFQTIKWADASFGVGQDDSGRLYVINSGVVSPLKVPFSYGGAAVNFDVSPNKQIYVSYGASVYMGGQTGNFKKIYTASGSKPVLAAGVGQVAVADETEEESAGATSPLLAAVNTSGGVVKKPLVVGNLIWSPENMYLANFNQSNLDIYDSSLSQVAAVQAPAIITGVSWLNSHELFYAANDQLWLYNLASGRADLVANMPLGDSIAGLAVSSDKSYVYITTSSSSGSYAIRRVGLKGQKVPDFIYQLQDILPESFSGYSLSVVNFVGPPTIEVQTYPYVGTTPQSDLQAAKKQLQQQGFDLSKLRFDLTAVET